MTNPDTKINERVTLKQIVNGGWVVKDKKTGCLIGGYNCTWSELHAKAIRRGYIEGLIRAREWDMDPNHPEKLVEKLKRYSWKLDDRELQSTCGDAAEKIEWLENKLGELEKTTQVTVVDIPVSLLEDGSTTECKNLLYLINSEFYKNSRSLCEERKIRYGSSMTSRLITIRNKDELMYIEDGDIVKIDGTYYMINLIK